MSEEKLLDVALSLRNLLVDEIAARTPIVEMLNTILNDAVNTLTFQNATVESPPKQGLYALREQSQDKPSNATLNGVIPTGFVAEHEWKGNKNRDGTHQPWNRVWGWNYLDKLPPKIVEELREGPIQIGGYELTLMDRIVQIQKIKEI